MRRIFTGGGQTVVGGGVTALVTADDSLWFLGKDCTLCWSGRIDLLVNGWRMAVSVACAHGELLPRFTSWLAVSAAQPLFDLSPDRHTTRVNDFPIDDHGQYEHYAVSHDVTHLFDRAIAGVAVRYSSSFRR